MTTAECAQKLCSATLKEFMAHSFLPHKFGVEWDRGKESRRVGVCETGEERVGGGM